MKDHNAKHIWIILKNFLKARTCEPLNIFKNVLWAPHTQLSLDNMIHTTKRNISILHN